MCIFGGGDGGAKALAAQQQQQADQARADATAREARINTGKANIDQAFSGFGDDFFNTLSKNYLDYAQPQLEDQYTQAKKNITYALARGGNTHSSAAGDQFGQLAKQYSTNQTGISGTAADYANQARRDVAADKSDVTNQLVATGDADAANAAALSAAKSLAVPISFSPLGSLFSNVSALAAQSKLAADATIPGYGGGVGGTGAGARLYGASGPGSYTVR